MAKTAFFAGVVFVVVFGVASSADGSGLDAKRCGDAFADDTDGHCAQHDDSSILDIPESHQINSQCQPPTVAHNGQCVLTGDQVLPKTLELASFTHLNCRGHRLIPSIAGRYRDEHVPSQPEVAIFLSHAEGVLVQNCVIAGFDFGILVLDGKITNDVRTRPAELARRRNRFLGNDIAAMQGIVVFYADNDQIEENRVDIVSGSGNGITLLRDSDVNVVRNNRITTSATAPGPGALFPGTPPQTKFSLMENIGVDLEETGPLVNFRFGKTFRQFLRTADVSDDNVIEDNQLALRPNVAGHDTLGIVISTSTRTVVTDNEVQMPTLAGINVTGFSGDSRVPGTCSRDSSRFCLSDADCSIAGVDTESKGICTGVTTKFVDGRSRECRVEDNRVVDPQTFDGIALVATDDAAIRGNHVTGAARSGIILADKALESATVSNNFVTKSTYGLALGGPLTANFFGARVFLNDITASLVRPILLREYGFPTELSFNGAGNYWGRPCSDDEGFVEAGKPGADSPATFVVDSHPFGVSVADGPEDGFPRPCK